MLLSILTPTFNCAHTINATLDSIAQLESKLPGRIQHLIGDAESSDSTLDILREYVANYSWASLNIYPQTNIPETLNELIKKSNGAWISVLNGDDYYDSNAMVSFLRQAALAEECDILCGDVAILSSDNRPIGIRTCNPARLNDYMAVNHPALVVPRQILEMVGPFDGSTPTNYDYAWFWRAYRRGVAFRYIPGVLAFMRGGGVSQTAAGRAAGEIFRIKMAEGAAPSAIKNYLAFVLKRQIRLIVPAWMIPSLVRWYRKVRGSVDRHQ